MLKDGKNVLDFNRKVFVLHKIAEGWKIIFTLSARIRTRSRSDASDGPHGGNPTLSGCCRLPFRRL